MNTTAQYYNLPERNICFTMICDSSTIPYFILCMRRTLAVYYKLGYQYELLIDLIPIHFSGDLITYIRRFVLIEKSLDQNKGYSSLE
jgi:uncharacterized membrane protein